MSTYLRSAIEPETMADITSHDYSYPTGYQCGCLRSSPITHRHHGWCEVDDDDEPTTPFYICDGKPPKDGE